MKIETNNSSNKINGKPNANANAKKKQQSPIDIKKTSSNLNMILVCYSFWNVLRAVSNCLCVDIRRIWFFFAVIQWNIWIRTV